MKYLAVVAVIFFLFAPEAAVEARLVPVQCEDPNLCGTCEFVELINNVVQFIIMLASLIAVGIFMYAGILMVVSGGNTDAVTKARTYFTNVAIGYVLILAAFLIVDQALKILLPSNSPVLGWRTVQCLYPTQAVFTPIRNPSATSSGLVGDGQTGPGQRGEAQCAADNQVCSVPSLTELGLTEAQANVMSCIAVTENSGRAIGCSGTGPCGAFQISRTDWRRYSPAVPGCEESNFANITEAQNNGSCNQRVMAVMVRSSRGYQPWTGQMPGQGPWNPAARRCVARYSPASDSTNRGF